MNCVLHYKLNDNLVTTNVVDSIGSYNGTAQQNTSVLHTAGKIDGAFTFNGTSDYIDTGSTLESIFQKTFSISMWVKLNDGIPSSGLIEDDLFGCSGGGKGGWIECWNYNEGLNFFYSYPPNAINAGGDVFEDGPTDWKHIVCVARQETPTQARALLYADGQLKTTGDLRTMNMANFELGLNFFIGLCNLEYSPENRYLNGAIDNVMIFDDELSQDDITYLWNNGNGTEDLSYFTTTTSQPTTTEEPTPPSVNVGHNNCLISMSLQDQLEELGFI